MQFFPRFFYSVWTFFLLFVPVPDLIQSFRSQFSWNCFSLRHLFGFGRMLVCLPEPMPVRVVIPVSECYSRISNFSFSWTAERKRNSYSMHRFIIYKIIETRVVSQLRKLHTETHTRMDTRRSISFLPHILCWDSSFTCWCRTSPYNVNEKLIENN